MSFSCTEMEMAGLSQVAEEPGQKQRGIGAGGLKLLELTSEVEGVSGWDSKEVRQGKGQAQGLHIPPPPTPSPRGTPSDWLEEET